MPQASSAIPGVPKASLATVIPSNVLADIFAYLAPVPQTIGLRWQPRSLAEGRQTLAHDHLLRVGGVCQAWRRAAASPSLWTTLEVDFVAEPTASMLGLMALFRVLLPRSRRLPLTIHLRIPIRQLEKIKGPFSVLAKTAPRWRVLNICDGYPQRQPHSDWPGSLKLPKRTKMPLLEELHVVPRNRLPINITTDKSPHLRRIFTGPVALPQTPNPAADEKAKKKATAARGRLSIPSQATEKYLTSHHKTPGNMFLALRQLGRTSGPLHLSIIPSSPPDPLAILPPTLGWGSLETQELNLTVGTPHRDNDLRTPAASGALDLIINRLMAPYLTRLTIASASNDVLSLSPATFAQFVGRNEHVMGVAHLEELHLLNVVFAERTHIITMPLGRPDAIKAEPLLSATQQAERWMSAVPHLTRLTLSDLPPRPAAAPLDPATAEPTHWRHVISSAFFAHLAACPQLLPKLVALTCYTTLRFHPRHLRALVLARPQLRVHLKVLDGARRVKVADAVYCPRVDVEPVLLFDERAKRSDWSAFW
ncbi:F-box domain-containing protein [Mycena indigotica]|uniref:F-box domain-containing protein n=1 Tax=Mycena indigotica TaxID=2126181 RepID=A0A8H6W849_9AGAR|nr:F-box domain-containing protein [Mycena indigotica]KAF7309329.1 F-box domain-containing protein [Mycena indigotica]